MNPEDTVAVIGAYPDGLVSPYLILWLTQEFKLPLDNLIVTRGVNGAMDVSFNQMVKLAIEEEKEWCLFADNDIHPTPDDSKALLESDLDLCCVKTPTGNMHAWDGKHPFHTGMWRAKTSTILSIGLPLFRWRTNSEQTGLKGCLCSPLAEKAAKLGFTVGHAGQAGHTARSHGTPPIMTFKRKMAT